MATSGSRTKRSDISAHLEVDPLPAQLDNNTNQSVVAADSFNQLSGNRGRAVSDSSGSVVFKLYLPVSLFNSYILFNSFCVYANVQRVRSLKNHEGTAMVQMSEAGVAERVVKYLTGCAQFHKLIEIKLTKYPLP